MTRSKVKISYSSIMAKEEIETALLKTLVADYLQKVSPGTARKLQVLIEIFSSSLTPGYISKPQLFVPRSPSQCPSSEVWLTQSISQANMDWQV